MFMPAGISCVAPSRKIYCHGNGSLVGRGVRVCRQIRLACLRVCKTRRPVPGRSAQSKPQVTKVVGEVLVLGNIPVKHDVIVVPVPLPGEMLCQVIGRKCL